MAKTQTSSAETLATRRLPCILVVDDKRATRLVRRELQTSRSYSVTPGWGGEEPPDALRAPRQDLILPDGITPGRWGYDFSPQLKDDPATRLIPIVMIT